MGASLSEFANGELWASYLQDRNQAKGELDSRILKKSAFYLSADDEINKLNELQISVERFKTEPFLQCDFPYRASLLRDHLNIKMPKVSCPKLEDWVHRLPLDEIQIVYASQFISSPASVVGHTFLKFMRNGGEDFLNQAFTYAANVSPDEGAISYIYNGLTGGFPGGFSRNSYYEKVQEYNNMEQRHLWEFSLKLDRKQRLGLAHYLWELIQLGEFKYYFFDENCSYMLLSMIVAITGDTDLLNQFPSYVVPHETIKALDQAGLISSSKLRPSMQSKLASRYERLSNVSRDKVLGLINRGSLTGQGELSVSEMDISLEILAYEREVNEAKLSAEQESLQRELLILRSKNKAISTSSIVDVSNPIYSHRPHLIDLSFNHNDKLNESISLQFRPGIHNFNDRGDSFLIDSSFSFFTLGLSYLVDAKEVDIKTFEIFNLKSTKEFSPLFKHFSWETRVGMYSDQLEYCQESKCFELDAKLGASIFQEKNPLSLLLGLHARKTNVLIRDHSWQYLLGGHLEFSYQLEKNYKLFHHLGYIYNFIAKKYESSLDLDFRAYRLFRNTDGFIRLSLQGEDFSNVYSEYAIGMTQGF